MCCVHFTDKGIEVKVEIVGIGTQFLSLLFLPCSTPLDGAKHLMNIE